MCACARRTGAGNPAIVTEDDFVFPETWRDLRGRSADDAAERERFELELRRELGKRHVLFGIAVSAVATCNGHCDDVLFALKDGRFAIVHLSYPGNAPDQPPWPDTEVFDDWAVAHVEVHAAT